MSNTCKESLCTRCAHLSVCSYRDKYLKLQEQINNLEISMIESDGATRFTKLQNIPWIRPVELSCIYFMENRLELLRNYFTSSGHSNGSEFINCASKEER